MWGGGLRRTQDVGLCKVGMVRAEWIINYQLFNRGGRDMGNTITICLIDWRRYARAEKEDFKVERATNTIDYIAGSFLSEMIVNDLCNAPTLEVKIRQAKNSDF